MIYPTYPIYYCTIEMTWNANILLKEEYIKVIYDRSVNGIR